MNPGRMRHTVRIEARSTTRDAAGEPKLEWSIFAAPRRAELVRTPGTEIFAQGRNGRVPTVFKLRHLDGVLPQMRLLFRDKVYNILSAIDPDGCRAELLVTTEELVEETP